MSNHRSSGSPYSGSATPRSLTSERIAADIAAFNKAGGRIEVLGNTPFQRPSKDAEKPTSANSAPPRPEQTANGK